jgi:tetratricopeptide (TPR) repeat protein
MNPTILRFTCGLFLLVHAGDAGADTVKLRGKPAFRNVQVVGLRDGRLVFKGVSRQHLRKPLAQIEWVEVDRVATLGPAERARAAERWAVAVRAYRQALEEIREPGLTGFARLRLLECCDRGGLFDEAVALYVELVRQDATLASEYTPRCPGRPGSPTNDAARGHLEAALALTRSATAASLWRNLLLEIVLYEEADDWPAALAEGGPPGGDQAGPTPASRSVEASPSSAPTAPSASRPLRLPADSLPLTAARAALAAGDTQRAHRLLERSLPFVDPADRGPWKLLLGRCRMELGRYAQAAAELAELAETDADPARAAEALYYLGLAHERMGRPEVAIRLYRELLARENLPAEVRTLARAGLRRVGE